MNMRNTILATAAAVILITSGCAVTRGQETVGAYVEDAAITANVKARFIEAKEVDSTSINVETLNGTVMLSGFAKNAAERASAELIAQRTDGVKTVKNQLAIRP